jgi:hypothetical protein
LEGNTWWKTDELKKQNIIEMKRFLVLMGACLLQFGVNAQTSVNATGGEATGGNVQMSYSIGEVVYTTASTTSYVITQGEQQPYIPPFNFSINAISPIICEGENTTISITVE